MNGQRLRPLGLGDIFDEGFDLYKRNFVFLLLVTSLAVVPLDILLDLFSLRLMPTIFDLFGVTATSDAAWTWLVVSIVKLTLFLPFFLLAVTPLVTAATGRYLERDQTLWQIYRPFLRRLPGLLILIALAGTALVFGAAFCLLGWLVPAVQFFFGLHAFVIEGKGPGKALGRSGSLVGGYASRVFNCLFLLSLITWVINLGITFPLSYLVDSVLNLTPGAQNFYGGVTGAGQLGEQQIVALISSGLAHLVLIPFLVCVVTVLYYDLRVRKEGFDVEMLAEDLRYPPLAALDPFLPPAPVFGPARPGVPPSSQPQGYGGIRR